MDSTLSNLVIIGCAMTGTTTPKEQNSNLPKIAEDICRVWQADAAMVHPNMRDENGKGVMD